MNKTVSQKPSDLLKTKIAAFGAKNGFSPNKLLISINTLEQLMRELTPDELVGAPDIFGLQILRVLEDNVLVVSYWK